MRSMSTLEYFFPAPHNARGLVVHKPHGCVRALREAADAEERGDATMADQLSYRLMVGRQELTDRSMDLKAKKEDDFFFHQLGSEVSTRLNLLLGWSLGEETMVSQLESCVRYHGTSIAVLDPALSAGHQRMCQAASVQPALVHFKLNFEDCPNRDDLFLWQQALYTLGKLEAQNGGNALVDLEGKKWRSTAGECPRDRFLCSWADEFLPILETALLERWPGRSTENAQSSYQLGTSGRAHSNRLRPCAAAGLADGGIDAQEYPRTGRRHQRAGLPRRTSS